MAVLERRVQVLFQVEQYESLRLLAEREGQSVGALVRSLVEERLSATTGQRREALQRLFASWDEAPSPVENWEKVKESFDEGWRGDIQ
jgi:hypothetical protein